MRVAPVTGDLLVKVAILGVGVIAAAYVLRQVQRRVSSAVDSAVAPFVDFGYLVSTGWEQATEAVGRAYEDAAETVTAGRDWVRTNVPTHAEPIPDNVPIAPWWLGGGAVTPPPTMVSGGGGVFAGNGATGSW